MRQARSFGLATALVLCSAAVAIASPPDANSAIKLAAAGRIFEDPASTPGKSVLTADDEKFLDDLQKRGIQFFIDEADPVSGLMPDRAKAAGGHSNEVASTASVGFGLTALCIGEKRGWVSRDDVYARSLRVLKFMRDKMPHERGHFYHFINMRTGEREWNCEISNIDMAILMAGVLMVRQHFPGTELATVANELYERVDWAWMCNDKGELHTGFKPEEGMYKGVWGAYSECPVFICLIGMGSRTHPLPAKSWNAWKREPVLTYAGLTFIQCPPLFTHQYPQCWFDLRGLRDDHANYFRNSQLATIVQRQWTIDELSKRWPTYGPETWGITASDGPNGYKAWGGPTVIVAGEGQPLRIELDPDIDGVVVPAAAAGSLAFEPRITLDALKSMREKFGEKGYLKYGFVDAFNPATGWYNPDVIGIDVGPSVVMAENCRSAFVWKTFMSAPEAQAALKAAGFRPVDWNNPAFMKTSLIGAGKLGAADAR